MSQELTDTFTCQMLELRDASVKVSHHGAIAFIPRSLINRMQIDKHNRVTINIAHWLYVNKFEKEDIQ